jgi:rubrerythrin
MRAMAGALDATAARWSDADGDGMVRAGRAKGNGMSSEQTARKLNALIHLEIDVVKTYEQALRHVDDDAYREDIARIKADNERHILELSEVMRSLGHVPPHFTRDAKGMLMAGLAAIRSATGAEGALKAMRANARLLDETYEHALNWDLPIEVQAQLQGYEADEKRHIELFDQELEALRV